MYSTDCGAFIITIIFLLSISLRKILGFAKNFIFLRGVVYRLRDGVILCCMQDDRICIFCGLLVRLRHYMAARVPWPQRGLLSSMGSPSVAKRSRTSKAAVILQLTSDFGIAIVLRPCRMFYSFLGSGRMSPSCLFWSSLLFVFL